MSRSSSSAARARAHGRVGPPTRRNRLAPHSPTFLQWPQSVPHYVGWTLLIGVALYGLYTYSAYQWGSAHFLNRTHQHLLPLQTQHPAAATATGGATPPSSSSDPAAAAAAASKPHGHHRRDSEALRKAAQPLSVCDKTDLGDIMASGLKESYSIWARPPGKLRDQLTGEVRHLAERHGVNAFPPHVTVLGDIERPREEVVRLMGELAAQVKKYRINFVDVTRGTFFYQCVFLSVAKDEGTMAAAAAARSVYGMTTPPYMPHLSLLYADMDDAKKAEVVEYETARLYGEGSGYDTLLVENGYDVVSFELWYTPTEDKSLQSWCLVGEFPFQG